MIRILNLCPPCSGGGVEASCDAAQGQCVAADIDGKGCISASELTRAVYRAAASNACP